MREWHTGINGWWPLLGEFPCVAATAAVFERDIILSSAVLKDPVVVRYKYKSKYKPIHLACFTSSRCVLVEPVPQDDHAQALALDMPADTSPALRCLWETAIPSEEAVDKIIAFGVRDFRRLVVCIPTSAARLLGLGTRTRTQSKELESLFKRNYDKKLFIVPINGKSTVPNDESLPWAYLLWCPFRCTLLLDTHDCHRGQVRKKSLLTRAAEVAAGLRDEWKNRMSKVSKPGKDPVVPVRYLTAARQAQPWRSAFDGAAAVRSVCQWIQRTVSGLTKLRQNMLSDADRANIIPVADGPTLRADLGSSLQKPQGQGVAHQDLLRRSSPRKRPNRPQMQVYQRRARQYRPEPRRM